jgi:enamine deaminase RidA (YjgF/YER057c/UK114 family)
MTDTITFSSTTPRLGLPMLFTGQAQKETYVNEAHSLIDALAQCAVEGSASAPPSAPVNGTNWLIGSGATGDWAGQDGKIGCYQSGNWMFATPFDGLRIFNRATHQFVHYSGAWQTVASVAAPSGGTTIDTQARTALANLISALQTAGVLPAS